MKIPLWSEVNMGNIEEPVTSSNALAFVLFLFETESCSVTQAEVHSAIIAHHSFELPILPPQPPK